MKLKYLLKAEMAVQDAQVLEEKNLLSLEGQMEEMEEKGQISLLNAQMI